MHEAESALTAELEQLAAAGQSRAPDWADVVRRSRPANRARRHALIALPLVFLAIALPAVALSAGLRSALGFGPRPTPVLSRAHLLVQAPVGNGFYAQAWRAPSTTGGTCLFLTHNRSSQHVRPILWNGGGSCSEHGGVALNFTTAQLPLAPGIGRRAKHGILRNWVPPIVFGSVYSKLHATRITLEWNGGAHDLAVRGSWFLGGTPALYMPSPDKFPFNVVAYDRAGHTLAHKTLQAKVLMLR